jgi:hypothetical protein
MSFLIVGPKVYFHQIFIINTRLLSQALFSKPSSFNSQVIIDNCLTLRSSLQSLSDKYKGPLEKSALRNTILPFVFLLGKAIFQTSSLVQLHSLISSHK